jgi:hypothetical protein
MYPWNKKSVGDQHKGETMPCLHSRESVNPSEKMQYLSDNGSMHEAEAIGDCKTKKQKKIWL